MGWEVHARRSDDSPDGVVCKIWSTVSDGYITNELTLDEAREHYWRGNLDVVTGNFTRNGGNLEQMLAEAKEHFEVFWEGAIENLLTNGQSHDYYGGEPGDGLDSPWREEM